MPLFAPCSPVTTPNARSSALRRERTPRYAEAAHRLPTDGLAVEEVVRRVVEIACTAGDGGALADGRDADTESPC